MNDGAETVIAFEEDATPARALAVALGAEFAAIEVHRFPDGEICPRVTRASAHTVLFAAMDHAEARVVRTLLTADACRRMQTLRTLTLAAPYLPYMRQDAAFRAGEPVSQSVICGLLATAFDRIVTVDPHLHRIRDLNAAYPAARWTALSAHAAIVPILQTECVPPALLVVGPDVESEPLVARFAAALGVASATFAKTRLGDRTVVFDAPAGLDVSGRPVLIVDDICSSGGSIAALSSRLHELGATRVEAVVTHALFDEAAAAAMRAAGVARIRSTDSCRHPTNAFPLAALLARGVSGALP